ncbi:hypothetical protein BJX96DRAFT_10629 [Aspergillus floccosus]
MSPYLLFPSPLPIVAIWAMSCFRLRLAIHFLLFPRSWAHEPSAFCLCFHLVWDFGENLLIDSLVGVLRECRIERLEMRSLRSLSLGRRDCFRRDYHHPHWRQLEQGPRY